MIQVKKPPPPASLAAGVVLTRENCTAFNRNENDYLDGTKSFKFERTIYGHKAVKNLLRKAQHRKCCFCEGRFEAFAAADVEHYRPKGAARQDENSTRLFPGYYWLAYSWANLYWCCQQCNRSHKKDLFPLADPDKRARSHRHDIADENPLLLDPGTTNDLRRHIQFRQEHAIGLSEAGKKTIQTVGLNRPALKEERQRLLKTLLVLQKLIHVYARSTCPNDINLLEGARRQLADAVRPEAPFSAMVVDFLESV